MTRKTLDDVLKPMSDAIAEEIKKHKEATNCSDEELALFLKKMLTGINPHIDLEVK